MPEESATTLVTLDGLAAIHGKVTRIMTFLGSDAARATAERLAERQE